MLHIINRKTMTREPHQIHTCTLYPLKLCSESLEVCPYRGKHLIYVQCFFICVLVVKFNAQVSQKSMTKQPTLAKKILCHQNVSSWPSSNDLSSQTTAWGFYLRVMWTGVNEGDLSDHSLALTSLQQGDFRWKGVKIKTSPIVVGNLTLSY